MTKRKEDKAVQEEPAPQPHVQHTTMPVRCCPDEPAKDVLWKLRANEPLWTPRPLSEAHPEAKAPSLSASGETREMFLQRQRAWQAAVDREEAAMAKETAS